MHKRSLGFSLIEILGAMAVGGIMMVGLNAIVNTSMEDVKGQQAAYYQGEVAAATGKYISANYGTLSTTASQGTPIVVTVDMLKTGGFLSDSVGATNAYGQTPCVLVLKDKNALDALVVTEGGASIGDLDLGGIAAKAGQGGGYISQADPATARGAYSSWQFTAATHPRLADFLSKSCSGTPAAAGHLATALFYNGPDQISADYLYRASIAGQPELNEMRTPIAMSGNALVTAGSACGSRAALAVDSTTRSLLTCGTDGLWHTASSWKSPVQNYGDLPAAGNANGDVRMVASLSKAFTYNGSAWVALAVDQNGNMDVPGALSANTLNAASQVVSNGTIAAQGDITSSKTVIGRGVQGDWVLGKFWSESQSLYVNQPAAAGQPCNIVTTNADGSTSITWAIGTIKRDVNGILLSCVWNGTGSTFRYANGQLTPPP